MLRSYLCKVFRGGEKFPGLIEADRQKLLPFQSVNFHSIFKQRKEGRVMRGY